MLTYFLPPLSTIGIIAGWARERALCAWNSGPVFWVRGPLNDNPRSPSHGESASVSFPVPTRHLGLAHGQHMDTVKPGHLCGGQA